MGAIQMDVLHLLILVPCAISLKLIPSSLLDSSDFLGVKSTTEKQHSENNGGLRESVTYAGFLRSDWILKQRTPKSSRLLVPHSVLICEIKNLCS
jgi:hypothetical protein